MRARTAVRRRAPIGGVCIIYMCVWYMVWAQRMCTIDGVSAEREETPQTHAKNHRGTSSEITLCEKTPHQGRPSQLTFCWARAR